LKDELAPILSLPVSFIIVLVIKLEDGGLILYKQERRGRGGIRFKAYKFRTMIPNSDELFGIKQASENDDRITRVGKLLRAMGLDELPQIINWLILMSFWIRFHGKPR
jgi:lipopolysaccharide/colanic/teichoic acid biosynthesis glycosyltransferase